MLHTRTSARSGGPRPLAGALLLVLAVSVLAACSTSSASPRSSASSGWVGAGKTNSPFAGDRLNAPVRLTAAARSVRFRASTGGTTTLNRLQAGRLMLLYFGYTQCPDVCPTTMADLGTALRQLPSVEQAHIQVVFVTSDPAQDTPGVLKTWLANFDQSLPLPFVGLTAKIKQVDAVAKSVGIPLEPPVRHPNGSVTVEHGAQTLAFQDGVAHLLWTAGTTPGQYAHDLRVLMQGGGGSS